MKPLQDLPDDPLVPLLRGADKIVVGNAQAVVQRPELGRRVVDELLGRDAAFACAHLHLLAVLVGADQEENLVAHQSPETRNDVGQHLFIGMPDVWRPVHVVNGSGQIERLHGEGSTVARTGRMSIPSAARF